jgi:sigma-54 dependent transcriptional regulator, flagellar regulatory protein
MGDPCFEALPDDDAAHPVEERGRLMSVPEAPPRMESGDRQASDELRARLKWFLLGRVAVISGFLAMVGVAYLGSGRERFDVPVDDLLLVVVATYAFSALSAMLLPYLRRAAAFAYVQIAFDIGLVSGVIYLTGGADSPFAFLYCLPIINGAVLLFEGGALFAAVCAALAYDGLLAALAGNPAVALAQPELSDPHIGMRIATTNVTFGLIAFLSSILTRRLHAAERLLRESQAERDHFALLQDTLARTIGSGLITTDAEGRITSISATAQELAGPEPEAIGRDIGAIFAPLRLTPSARLRFLQSVAEPIEFLHPSADGADCHLRCVGAPLTDTFGHPIGALYVLQNVTPLKELAAQPDEPEQLEQLCRVELDAAAEVAEAADGLYGVSPGIGRIRTVIDRVAQSDATVLVAGESGTGKEVVARAIHARSPRRDKRFVAINCGAIPEHLIESELFGHVRGAFTGAVADRPGCFRSADGGTLFLDEISDLPLHLQVKLLRVLQERTFRPVGSETTVAVDVRIIAATNRDLPAQVKQGTFREDLFYRLNVITIDLPPLRERREDIPLLIRHLLRQFSDLHGRRVSGFSIAAGRLLLQHHYPGNIRELENIVEHTVALCDDDMASEEHLPQYLLGEPHAQTPAPIAPRPRDAQTTDTIGAQERPFEARPANGAERGNGTDSYDDERRAATCPPSPLRAPLPADCVDLERDLAEYEKAILLRALDQAGGVKKRAAELLGINYRSLRHRLQKYGLSDGADDASLVQ